VQKLYYLVAVEVKEWFLTEFGYKEAYKEKIKSLLEKLKEISTAHSLDAEALQCFTDDEIDIVFKQSGMRQCDIDKVRNCLNDLRIFYCPVMDYESRKNAIRVENKYAKRFLEKIGKGEIVHYHFLPLSSYQGSDDKSSGLMVDLQEIGMISTEDAEKIQSPGIDHKLLMDIHPDESLRLQKQFWLESDDDYIFEHDIVKSPWIEHLMQRFSHGFIRIGVDEATTDDYTQLVGRI
jgi:hypothetical protein